MTKINCVFSAFGVMTRDELSQVVSNINGNNLLSAHKYLVSIEQDYEQFLKEVSLAMLLE